VKLTLNLNCFFSRDPTPLERFTANTVEWSSNTPTGVTLGSPFSRDENNESGDKCLYTENGGGDAIWTDRCSTENPWLVGQFKQVGVYKYLIIR